MYSRARERARERRAQQPDAAAGVEHAAHRQADVIRVRRDETSRAPSSRRARSRRCANRNRSAGNTPCRNVRAHALVLASSRRTARRTSSPPASPDQADDRARCMAPNQLSMNSATRASHGLAARCRPWAPARRSRTASRAREELAVDRDDLAGRRLEADARPIARGVAVGDLAVANHFAGGAHRVAGEAQRPPGRDSLPATGSPRPARAAAGLRGPGFGMPFARFTESQ